MGLRIICAFCLSTSAGVRMKHDTNSAVADAALWMNGWGIKFELPLPNVEFTFDRPAFMAS